MMMQLSVYQKEEVPTVTRSRILVKLAGTDTVFGYFAQPRTQGSLPDWTADPSTATWFEKEELAAGGDLFNIRKVVRLGIIS